MLRSQEDIGRAAIVGRIVPCKANLPAFERRHYQNDPEFFADRLRRGADRTLELANEKASTLADRHWEWITIADEIRRRGRVRAFVRELGRIVKPIDDSPEEYGFALACASQKELYIAAARALEIEI